ncbi:NupC/NupG family nucleoside CNT transporter [Alteribacter lacisalsi]|uniref:Nucleoside permease n=1 Tax=Alteribacter lacisalsi TaxID=2045244 RepID=A0A2W0HIN5_9BACI|nr:NupC/NupG family nucleoside CNT transporter [Alteribacter lacisalsi]PYZ96842.1 NupC/NupG family nucleoside CNT transporter [Alteribacter lacisalsi]
MDILWGLFGIVVVLGIAFLLSNNRKAIKPRTILAGLAIQITFAFIVLQWDLGRAALQQFTLAVSSIIDFAMEGVDFVFGGIFEGDNIGFIFAFEVLPVIIFFSSLISVLYYIGIMQWVVKIVGGFLEKVLATSKTESMSAAANIFLGQTEAPLVVKPYIARMTNSELFAIMTGGLASVAGSVLIGYSLLGVPLEFLLAASFMAAPAGLIMAKMMVPETADMSERSDENLELGKDTDSANVIDAAARGASVGLQLALNIGAMLIAFIALIALVNGFISLIGTPFGAENLTIEQILGFVFAPLAVAIGVPIQEAVAAGGFIGQKLVLNEFVAYLSFAETMDELTPKTVAIVTFALCGFANLSSLGILLGGLGKLAPERRKDIARLGVRAVTAGMLASLLSAAIAGIMLSF